MHFACLDVSPCGSCRVVEKLATVSRVSFNSASPAIAFRVESWGKEKSVGREIAGEAGYLVKRLARLI